MNLNLTLFTGPGLEYYQLNPSELNKFTRIGNGKDYIKLADIEKQTQSPVALINAHGFVLNKEGEIDPNDPKIACIQLIANEYFTSDNIYLIQKKLNTRHFYLFSCFSGVLPDFLSRYYTGNLLENTTITIFCSAKYPMLVNETEKTIRKIQSFYQTHKDCTPKEIDRKFFLENALFTPSTVVRCEITKRDGEQKFTAFKVSAPKKKEDIKNFSNYINRKNKLNPIIIEDQELYLKWTEMANKTSNNTNLEEYKNRSLLHSAFRGKLERFKEWVNVGANINFNANSSSMDFSALHLACINGKMEIVKFLIDNGVIINHKAIKGVTALYLACQYGHKDIVQALLNAQAEFDSANDREYTPFYIACINGHKETVQMLLNKGVDVNHKNNGISALHFVCQNGHNEIVQLLLDKGADVNYKAKNGLSPLYLACQNGHKDIVQILLDKGAESDPIWIENSFTPLFIACQKGHIEIVQMLLDKGADVNHKNNYSNSPLHLACLNGHKEIVQILLDKGADVNHKNSDGLSPLHMANQNGHNEIVQFLNSADEIIDIDLKLV